MYNYFVKLPLLLLFSLSLALVSCSEGTTVGGKSDPENGRYVSYRGSTDNRGGANGLDENEGINNAFGAPGNNDNSGDTNREIIEADIVKVEGDTLYALSAYRGLVVLDIGTQDQIDVLGRYPVYGHPFEMYIEEGLAYIMFSSYWTYTWDETLGYGSWNSSSKLVVLDVQDPHNINQVATYDLAGEISDSRLVGDILYLVATENGYCWNCSTTPRTTITSLSTGDINDIRVVDQLAFDAEEYGWGKLPIFVNQNRIYVAQNNYVEGRSAVQAIDISDPSGVMQLGDEVLLAGRIESRWQMNEYDGVFRTISQRGWVGQAPVVETFTVTPTALTPLGSLTMSLPRPEDLRSVRFDGTRAYAVTFEQVDPLFTIDLSDPANPVQRGMLEIPGWLHHMEPRGDRMIALGFDNDDEQQLTMSLFDVSNLDTPTMLDRESFGAEWSFFTEDQDRIHKALKIMDDEGVILMPYAGWGASGFESGVQIFSFTDHNILKRGLVPHYGFARRAFMHNDRLFAMSDERVESFNVNDLDAPVRT
ncbi:MAG: hypothetical protein CSA75_04440, partial [Sorangium cellulosum]